MSTRSLTATLAVLSAATMLACGAPPAIETSTPPSQTETDREFLEAVPDSSALQLLVPAPAPPTPGSGSGTSRPLIGQTSELYLVTYRTAVGINRGIVGHLDLIENIISHRPTSRHKNRRVWGPHTGPLSPSTYTFVVEKNAPGRYSYVLMGKPKAAADSAYMPVFAGEITRGALPRRGAGNILVNFDNARRLDPAAREIGAARVTFDTRQGKVAVAVAMRGVSNGKGRTADALYRYLLNADGTGELRFAVTADIDQGRKGRTAKETGLMRSRWVKGGAGRADVLYTGGDLGKLQVVISECWDSLFRRTFYTDNKGIKPVEGAPGACVYRATQPPKQI